MRVSFCRIRVILDSVSEVRFDWGQFEKIFPNIVFKCALFTVDFNGSCYEFD